MKRIADNERIREVIMKKFWEKLTADTDASVQAVEDLKGGILEKIKTLAWKLNYN
jgi:hypothetical protein